jgi:hypothetical protein
LRGFQPEASDKAAETSSFPAVRPSCYLLALPEALAMKLILACAWRAACRVSFGLILLAVATAQPLDGLRAARGEAKIDNDAIEVRNFHISVDDNRCGNLRMSIEARPDGRHVVLGDSSLELKYFLYTFRFSSQGNEIWNGGILERLENAANYGSSRYQVSATGKGNALVVKADGQERKLPRNVWTTSYWHEPEEHLHGQTVSLLDSHKGRSLKAKLERVGEETIKLGDKEQTCVHYRLRGDVQVDLWYDEAGRLVRQEAIESGHRTRIQLVAIK